MTTTPDRPDEPAPFCEEAYERLLQEIRQVTEQIVDRLRALRNQFPGDIPAQDLAGVERAQDHPKEDRRQGLRRHGFTVRVEVRPADGPWMEQTTLEDHSLNGIGFRLRRPLPAGAFLEVCL